MKALALANQQGQTIYTITKDNYSEVLPNLNHGDDVMTDIRKAVYANKEVTVHQSQLNFKSWKGSGYIIIDPKTGTGGYMIGGGGATLADNLLLYFLMGIAAGGIAGAGLATLMMGGLLPIIIGIIAIVLATIITTIILNSLFSSGQDKQAKCFLIGLGIGIPLGIAFGGAAFTLMPILGAMLGIFMTFGIKNSRGNRLVSISRCLSV